MRILNWNVPSSYELICFGDNQEGNRLQDHDAYRETIDYVISGKNRFAIHMGDEQEAYWIDDPRYDPFIIDRSPLEQQKQVIEDLRPLAKHKRLIALLFGNHSYRLYPKIGNITLDTCQKLGIQYGGFACTVAFEDRHGVQFSGYFTHGKRLVRSIADDPIRKEANEQLQVKQHLKRKMGHTIFMAKGHCHRLISVSPNPELYLATDQEKIHQYYTEAGGEGYIHPDQRWYAATGSFLRTFGENIEGYGEINEYDPVEIGHIVCEIVDRKIQNVRKVVL